MIDYNARLRTLLSQANIPVYYEAFKQKEATPCISYMEVNNSVYAIGDTLNYSNLSYMVKVWAETITEANAIANDINSILAASGFTRVSSQDMVDNNLMMKVMRFNAIGLEQEVN